MQAVRVFGAVRQALRERVAAGVAQRRVFPALQTSLSQQNGPDLTHGLTPLLLPARRGTRRLQLCICERAHRKRLERGEAPSKRTWKAIG